MKLLLFAISMCALLAYSQKSGTRHPHEEARKALKQLTQIHQSLFEYAAAHQHVFPVGKNSNEAFRQLISKGLIDESVFYLEGTKGKPPDGKIGDSSDGYKAALAPGECSFHYISGLTTDRDDSTLPLAFAKVKGDDGTAYIVVVRVGGNCRIYESTDGIARVDKGGKMVDIFSKEYGTDPNKILAPVEVSKE